MNNNKGIIAFDTGFVFMHDLLVCYDKAIAVQIAKNYLDMQSHINGTLDNFRNNNPEEYTFCCELYKAMKKAENDK